MLYDVVAQNSDSTCHAKAEICLTQSEKALVRYGVVAVNQELDSPNEDAL
jgi:hypothetical protein